MKIRFKKLHKRAITPTYGTEFSAGADLYALSESGAPISVSGGSTVLIRTGISVEIPEGYCGLVFARSSMGAKRGLAPANKVGVIDSDYRGEIMVTLHNHSETVARVEPSERIAQLAIVPFLKAEFEEATELSDTIRGAGGFGSTGR